MTNEILTQKKRWLNDIRKNYSLFEQDWGVLYHYTSLPVLFSILENDFLWASGTRFSNDSSEEVLLANKEFSDLNYTGDSFIVCLTNKIDCLSQWRGYCFNGGAAIELDMMAPRKYSILHADYETSRKNELEVNAPLPVLYVEQEHLLPTSTSLSGQLQSDSLKGTYKPAKVRDMIPYFKDRAFEEESEWRLMFGNHNGELSKCIRFRTLRDGSKVPYIVVMAGELGKNYSKCAFNIKDYSSDEDLDKLIADGFSEICIPQGNNQSSIYYKLEEIVANYNKRHKANIKIYCKGHLPIRRIIVAPTYDRMRIAEKIKRYCWNNYWLRNVEVTESKIPYIPPSE